MQALLEVVLSGAVLGGMYALLAMGLTLQYGVARIMNLSYGDLLIVAAFCAYTLFGSAGLTPLVTIALVLPLAFVLSWATYRFLLAPLVRRARSRDALEVDSLLVTFGLLFVVQGALLLTFGGDYYRYSYLSVPLDVFGTTLAANRILAFVVAAVIGSALYLLLMHTRAGTAIRAIAVNPTAAQLSGIDVAAGAALAFAVGGTLAATGGVLISMFLTFNATHGVLYTMKALIIVIMGGVGNIGGCLLAGLLLGLTETFVARYADPGLTLAATYALFLLVLLLRPAGLFGSVRS